MAIGRIIILLSFLLAPLASGQGVINIPPSTQPTVINVPPTVVQMQPAPVPAPTTRMAIGTNVQANDSVNGGGMWGDFSRQMTGWFAAAGATGLTYDANGYPVAVQGPGQAASWGYLYGYAGGVFNLTYTGPPNALTVQGKQITFTSDNAGGWRGQVSFNPNDRVEFRSPGGITNVHLIAPDAIPGRTFREAYLTRLMPYKVVRLMPLEHVNGNGLPPAIHTNWSQRVRPENWDQTSWEIALEYQAQLCRESGTIPWVCLPYGVDDDTAAKAAACFLNFGVVYIECSNELWNTAPAYQGMTVRNDAINMGTYGSGDPNVAGARRAAEQAARVGKIWKMVLGAAHVKTVFGAQATWDAWAVNGLGWLKPGDVDALAIAPYFQPGDALTNPTVPQVLASCGTWVDTVLAPNIAANYRAATKFGIPLICYEGGQHLLPAAKGPSTEFQWQGDLTPAEWQKYLADPYRMAQLDAGIGPVYDRLFDACRGNGVTLFCNFMVNSNWGRSGFWGLTQAVNDPANPKTQALGRAIAAGN